MTVIAAGFGDAGNSGARPARLTTGHAGTAGTRGAAFHPSSFPASTE